VGFEIRLENEALNFIRSLSIDLQEDFWDLVDQLATTAIDAPPANSLGPELHLFIRIDNRKVFGAAFTLLTDYETRTLYVPWIAPLRRA
jgi:hypothetical protein